MRVLLLEDDLQLSFVWQEVLTDMGCEVVTSTSIDGAMGHVLRGGFDLYVMDLFLEDGNSLSLTDWVATRTPDVPILLLTGSQVMPAGEHTDLAPGVTWMVRKPISIEEFRAYVEHLLERPKAQKTA